MKGNEGPKRQKLQTGAGPGTVKFFVLKIGKTAHLWPKCKEIKAQDAKMQGNQGPKCQSARKWRSKMPKCKEMKA